MVGWNSFIGGLHLEGKECTYNSLCNRLTIKITELENDMFRILRQVSLEAGG